MTVEPGQTLLHYTLTEKLGEGGMGEVWVAEDSKLNRKVALKILPTSMTGDPERRARFEREAQTVAALNPTYIVPGHGAPTDLAGATADTYDYLVNLRAQMGLFIDDGGDIIESVNVEQGAFAYLENFDGLAKRNAQQVYSEMEWE